MKYACNPEGVAALNSAASSVKDAIEEITNLTSSLRSSADEYSDTIGPHFSELEEALEGIESNVNSSTSPAEVVAESLMAVAEGYQDIIDRGLGVSSGN